MLFAATYLRRRWLAAIAVLSSVVQGCPAPAPPADSGNDAADAPVDRPPVDASDVAVPDDAVVVDASDDVGGDAGSIDAASDVLVADAVNTTDGATDAPTADIVCAMGESVCAGACVNTQSSASHCGACGRSCPGSVPCVAGTCRPRFASTLASPVIVPNTAGCSFAPDNFNQQITVSPEGTVWVLARCATELRVGRSVDGAASFGAAMPLPLNASATAGVAIHARSSLEAFVFVAEAGSLPVVHRTTDGGATWTRRAGALPATALRPSMPGFVSASVSARGSTLFFGYTSSPTTVVRSNDDGDTWTQLTSAGPAGGSAFNIDVAPLGADGVVAECAVPAVYRRSFFDGTSWVGRRAATPNAWHADSAHSGSLAVWTNGDEPVGIIYRETLDGAGVATRSEMTRTVVGDRERSIDADPAGNAWVAIRVPITTDVMIYLWEPSNTAPSLLASRWVTGSTMPVPAIAAIPTQLGSVTAVPLATGVHVVTIVR
ncbi:MAG: hypothetical protein JNK05_19155 [Myxococcales bacterium]|nr:hypothetical protein [Myxococcales bacterium]